MASLATKCQVLNLRVGRSRDQVVQKGPLVAIIQFETYQHAIKEVWPSSTTSCCLDFLAHLLNVTLSLVNLSWNASQGASRAVKVLGFTQITPSPSELMALILKKEACFTRALNKRSDVHLDSIQVVKVQCQNDMLIPRAFSLLFFCPCWGGGVGKRPWKWNKLKIN